MHAPSRIHAPLRYDDLIDLHYLLEADELSLQLMADSFLTEDVR